MRLPLLAVLLLTAFALPARAEPGAVLLLSTTRFAEEERGLVEALRIYTRDLRISVELGGTLAGAGPIAQAADLGARDGAELVVWFDGEPQLPSLFAYRVATGELRATPATPRDDRDLCSQTLALKLRALLVDRGDLRDWVAASTPARAAGGPATEPDAAPPPPVVSPRPGGEARPVELEVGTGYRFDVPSEAALVRHAVVARVGLAFTRRPIDLTLDGGYAFRAETSSGGGRAGVSDIPLGVAACVRFRRPRYQLAAGPRGALHLFGVDGSSSDGRAASQRVVSVGLGLTAEARLRLGESAALFVAGAFEALLPRHRFEVDGAVALDTGPLLVQASAGLVVRLW